MNKNTTHKSVPISQIKIADRILVGVGDVSDLQSDIEAVGVINDLDVDDDFNLLAGEGRLRACLNLGLSEVPVTIHHGLTALEKLRLEVSENDKGKRLRAYDKSRRRLGVILEAEAIFLPARKISQTAGRKALTGVSVREVAEALGMSAATVEQTKKHVAIVEKYPDLADLSARKAFAAGKVREEKKAEALKPPRKPRQSKPEPAPEVVKVHDLNLSGVAYERMDTMIELYGYRSRSGVVEAALELLQNTLEGTEATREEVGTLYVEPVVELPARYPKGTWYCSGCGRVLPPERATPARLKNPCMVGGCRRELVQA